VPGSTSSAKRSMSPPACGFNFQWPGPADMPRGDCHILEHLKKSVAPLCCGEGRCARFRAWPVCFLEQSAEKERGGAAIKLVEFQIFLTLTTSALPPLRPPPPRRLPFGRLAGAKRRSPCRSGGAGGADAA